MEKAKVQPIDQILLRKVVSEAAKNFAPWAPQEASQDAVEYLTNLKSNIKAYTSQL